MIHNLGYGKMLLDILLEEVRAESRKAIDIIGRGRRRSAKRNTIS